MSDMTDYLTFGELNKLYPRLYKKAIDYAYKELSTEDFKLYTSDDVEITSAFTFDETLEGHDFWIAMFEKNFRRAWEVCPDAFEEKKKSTGPALTKDDLYKIACIGFSIVQRNGVTRAWPDVVPTEDDAEIIKENIKKYLEKKFQKD